MNNQPTTTRHIPLSIHRYNIVCTIYYTQAVCKYSSKHYGCVYYKNLNGAGKVDYSRIENIGLPTSKYYNL